MDLDRSCFLAALSQPELYVHTYHGGNAWDIGHHRMNRAAALSDEESARLSELIG
jgi:hypothetical protein